MRTFKLRTFILATITLLFLCSILAGNILSESKKPKVFLLYTAFSPYPDFLVRMSTLPLAIASWIKFGEPSFQAEFATLKSAARIIEGKAGAKALIVGTHGTRGGFMTDDNALVLPAVKKPIDEMRLAYFGSCHFGEKRNEWQAKYPKAKVIGYDGLTYPWTTWRYMVFHAPIDILTMTK